MFKKILIANRSSSLRAERSNPVSAQFLDCRVAALLAMTVE
jgi:hypothetical protein